MPLATAKKKPVAAPGKLMFDAARPLSWSAISSFEWDPEQWYAKYVLKEEQHTSSEMEFGKLIGERLASDATFLPHVPRQAHYEFELKGKLGTIPLIGFIDSYTPHKFLEEYKTGVKPWDQKRADTHGQIDMYLLMIYLMFKVKPEDVSVRIHWLPTQKSGDFSITFIDEKDIRTFKTKRTMADILRFGKRIKETHAAMTAYCLNHA